MKKDPSISINGEMKSFTALPNGNLSVLDILAQLGLEARKVAVEQNEEIIPLSCYTTRQISDGDRLEIVHFIGGG